MENPLLSELVNGAECRTEWECQWSETFKYSDCRINSRRVNLTSVTEIKDFVSCLPEGNNVNFAIIKTRKNVW